MRFKIFLSLLVFFVSIGVNDLQAQPNTQKDIVTEKLYINPAYAQGGIDTQVFKSITYLPLETTKESLFGEIFKMEITDDYYIVSDRNTNSILLFQKNGKFYAKIDGGKFPNAQLNPTFTVDREQKLIITRISSIPGKLVWFNFKGNVVKETPIKEFYNSIASLNSSTLAYSPFTFLSGKVKSDSVNYFIKFLNNGEIEKKMQPFNVAQYAMSPNLSFAIDRIRPYYFYYSGIKNNLLYVENYNYNIYSLNEQGIQKIYNVVFPQDLSLSPDSLTHRLSLTDKEKYVKDNDKKIYSFRGVYLIGDYLYFETIKSEFYTTDPYLIYNLKSKSLISLKKVSSGSAACFLPLTTDFGTIVGCDGEYVYSALSSLEMFEAKEATASKKPNYPSALQTYFNTQSRKSNPVLVLLKPKAN